MPVAFLLHAFQLKLAYLCQRGQLFHGGRRREGVDHVSDSRILKKINKCGGKVAETVAETPTLNPTLSPMGLQEEKHSRENA